MDQISERDWKEWRRLSSVALERFCARVLKEAAAFEKGPDTAHARYLELFEYLRKRDDQIGEAFNNPRRSVAFAQIANAVANGIIFREELERFSEETQDVLHLILGE